MTAVDHETLVAHLDRLKLTAIRDQLDTLLDEAARSKMTLREALAFLVAREIARRDERRISMASKIAQFPFVRDLDGFEFEAQPSLDAGQIRELATCRWIAHGDMVLLLGPPGTGKTHLAVALGRAAIRQSYSVQFVTAATLVAMLAKVGLRSAASLPPACSRGWPCPPVPRPCCARSELSRCRPQGDR